MFCSIAGCGQSAETSKAGRRGLCRLHYREWLATPGGDKNQEPLYLPGERWRPAYEHPDFLVSDHGRVWSIPRVDSRGQKRGGYFLKPHTYNKTTQHRRVRLNNRFIMLHRLVLSSFVRPPDEGEVCRHLDGDASHNFVGNLAWGTHMDNAMDKIRHGTSGRVTECKYGHPFDEENTRYDKDGYKTCRACAREYKRLRRQDPVWVAKKREADRQYGERKRGERKAMQGDRKG